MDIESLADACGGLAWISEQLYEIEGRLAVASGDGERLAAEARGLLARSSRRYGQHSQWWRDLLPDSPALAGPDRVRCPTDGWARLFSEIRDSTPSGAVAALYQVALPQMIAVIEHLRRELSPVGDGAVIRTARMVAADLAEEEHDAKEAWNPPNAPSDGGLEKLADGFADDYREKRWPPLLPYPR